MSDDAGPAPRPFQFMVACRDVVDAKTLAERARWAESIGCSHVAIHDHLAAAARADPVAHRRGDGDRAPPALPARVQQRPAPSGRPGPGARQPGHPQRRAPGGGHRGRLERARIPRDRPRLRSAGDQDRAADRGHRRSCAGCSRTARSATRAGSTRSRRWTGSRSRSSGRIRRSSSAGRGSASSAWRLGRPTSSGSTCARTARRSWMPSRRGPMSASAGSGRRPATGSSELDISVLRLLGDITITREPLKVAAEVARQLTRPDGRPDHRAGRPRVALLADRVGPRARRQAHPDTAALGHQLVPDRLVRRAQAARHRARRGAAGRGVGLGWLERAVGLRGRLTTSRVNCPMEQGDGAPC